MSNTYDVVIIGNGLLAYPIAIYPLKLKTQIQMEMFNMYEYGHVYKSKPVLNLKPVAH